MKKFFEWLRGIAASPRPDKSERPNNQSSFKPVRVIARWIWYLLLLLSFLLNVVGFLGDLAFLGELLQWAQDNFGVAVDWLKSLKD